MIMLGALMNRNESMLMRASFVSLYSRDKECDVEMTTCCADVCVCSEIWGSIQQTHTKRRITEADCVCVCKLSHGLLLTAADFY